MNDVVTNGNSEIVNVVEPNLYAGVAQKLASRTVACSKIKVDYDKVKAVVEKLFNYISYFNSLSAYDIQALGRQLEDIEIINELVPFIIPRSVRLSVADINSTDLLVRDEFPMVEKSVLSYSDFMDCQITFRGYFKKDVRTDFKTLAAIKVDESLANILPRMAVNIDGQLRVRYVADAYVPIKLNSVCGNFYRPQYFNTSAADVIQDYLAPITF